ncbi:small conductance mechanosensitive channel [Actinokineospora alba]|uniref:Small conductance mechanosensitive channel n=1 Tax=Actinokineospora alba TaxID=504798 RepID=A0A1H0KIL5_9PSEU|nr:mechanosensitive ion channel family protein [Actinokineospora alba]TDP67886.1 small conductance mechanosensitive channel [Actinokineospora alba]SDH88197.1 small conductance mechanosensitive channel [Actinokineospora alba]SDO55788.1 small conductance mechanosensitive channel [Actinokineospora alba]
MNPLPFALEPPKCVDTDAWCKQVFDLTHNQWLAASANWLVAKPIKIVMILLIAFVIRLIARRLIERLTSGNGKMPRLLRPLRERAPQALTMLSERRSQRAKTIGSVLNSILSFAIYGLAFILILGELGVNLAPIIASAGIVGVALGFGAQHLVKDFLSGIFMMLEDQYGVGDNVNLGEAIGTIEAVGLRVTTLRDVNGTVWYVRNGEILRVGNSSQGFAVAVLDLPVGYSADVDQVTTILSRVAAEVAADETFSKDVIEPPEVLGVEKVTPESITIRMTVKVRPGRQYAVQRALRARAMAAVEEAGIQPPLGRLFPQSPA